jgi:hypothetical protein
MSVLVNSNGEFRLNKTMYEIVYPERRWVTADRLIIWACDAVANGDTSIEATREEIQADVGLAIEILHDSGYATVTTRRNDEDYTM